MDLLVRKIRFLEQSLSGCRKTERSTFLSRMIKRQNVRSPVMIALEGEGKGPKNAGCEKVLKGKYPRGQEAGRQRKKNGL